jgi:hypothetical protein
MDTFVHQSKYLHNQNLHGYDVAMLNLVCTPMESRLKLSKENHLETKKNIKCQFTLTYKWWATSCMPFSTISLIVHMLLIVLHNTCLIPTLFISKLLNV